MGSGELAKLLGTDPFILPGLELIDLAKCVAFGDGVKVSRVELTKKY